MSLPINISSKKGKYGEIKKTIKVLVSGFIIYTIIVYGMWFVTDYWLYKTVEKTDNQIYQERIQEKMTKTGEVDFQDIFEFEYDYVYLSPDEYFDTDDMKNVLI